MESSPDEQTRRKVEVKFTSQRGWMKEISQIRRGIAQMKPGITLISETKTRTQLVHWRHCWRALVCCLCTYLHTGHTHLMRVPMHWTCECVCVWTKCDRGSRGLFTKTGLASPKAATGMWGSTSLLWQCTCKHTRTCFLVAHCHIYLPFYYYDSSPPVVTIFSLGV